MVEWLRMSTSRREFLGALTALGAIGVCVPSEVSAAPSMAMVTNRRFHLAGIETKPVPLEVTSLDSFSMLSVTTPGSPAPIHLFVCTWEDPECKEIEAYVRMKALSPALRDTVRSFIKLDTFVKGGVS